MKKYFLISIVVFLLLSTSCNNIKDFASNSPNSDPVTFTVLFNDKSATPFKSDWKILDEYLSRKNVKLDFFLGDDANYTESIYQYINSGNPPDILLKCYPNEIGEYINNGLLLPISDYIEKMPYFKAYIDDNNLWSEIDKLRQSNGKFYILPGYQRETQVQQWIYRKDIFDKQNLKPPETYDELYDDLVLLKETYGNSSNISASWGGAHLFSMMGAGYNINSGWSGSRSYDYENDTWFFSPASDNYRSMLEYLNKCYSAGVLDPDIFTQSNDDFITKLISGKSFVTVTWISSGFENWNKSLEENGEIGGEWYPLSVPESTLGIRALPAVNTFRKGLVLSAQTVDKPYFDELLSFIDWAVYSDDGMTLTTWGVKDLTYFEKDSVKSYIPSITFPGNTSGSIDATGEYGLNAIFDLNENVEYENAKKPDYIVEFLNDSILRGDTSKDLPFLILSENETEVINIIQDKINDYVNSSMNDFITGTLDIQKDWESYISKLDDMGYSTIEKTWNDAWKRQNN